MRIPAASLLPLALLFLQPNATAQLESKTVDYSEGNSTMEGFLAVDTSIKGKRPGILVIHDWTGMGDYAVTRTKQLAKMGYVAFAADVYGKGVRPKTNKECGIQAGKYRGDRPLLRRRVLAALNELKKHPLTDSSKLAAIGYCFGGTSVLELARSGADIDGVVSFHGGLSTPTPDDAKNIKCKVLACHGADDPHVKPEEVAAFHQEMRNANVDYQFIAYGGAVHSFTKPAAGSDNSKGSAYNEKADRRSGTR